MITTVCVCGLLCIGLTGTANADSVPLFNSRPDGKVAINAAPATGDPLQSILDEIYGCNGCVDADDDQKDSAMWATSVSTNPTVAATLQVAFSGGSVGDEFGIFSMVNDLPIFIPIFKTLQQTNPTDPGTGTPSGTSAILQWTKTGKLNIVGVAADDSTDPACPTQVNCQNNVVGISSKAFGFYVQNGAGEKFFTLDSQNPSGSPQAVAYQYNSDWVIAFSDAMNQGNTAGSYNNVVVDVQSITALPEPRSIVMLGTTLLLICGLCRRKFGHPGRSTK